MLLERQKPEARMASIVQFEQPAKTARSKVDSIDPKLKAFIDRVVVPILVQEYLEMLERENHVADAAGEVALYSVSPVVPKVVR